MQNRIFLFSNNRISVKEIIDNSDGLVLASKKYEKNTKMLALVPKSDYNIRNSPEGEKI